MTAPTMENSQERELKALEPELLKALKNVNQSNLQDCHEAAGEIVRSKRANSDSHVRSLWF